VQGQALNIFRHRVSQQLAARADAASNEAADHEIAKRLHELQLEEAAARPSTLLPSPPASPEDLAAIAALEAGTGSGTSFVAAQNGHCHRGFGATEAAGHDFAREAGHDFAAQGRAPASRLAAGAAVAAALQRGGPPPPPPPPSRQARNAADDRLYYVSSRVRYRSSFPK